MSNLTSIIRGTKEKYLEQTTIDNDALYALTNMPEYSISNADMLLAVTTQKDLFEVGEIFICSDSGNYLKGHIYQVKVTNGVKSWEDITPASGDLQNYQIVTAEPEDKSEGKMIYEKSSGVTLGKAVIDKTAGADQYYSSPAGLVDKIFGGTAVPSDIETYEYLLFKENEYVGGYINIGDLPELTQYALTHNSIEVIFKVNNGAEQSDILTKNSDGSFGNTSNKFQTIKSQNLVEGAGSDYYTLDLQAGGVAQSFKVAETDTIQITKLKLGDVYINIDKGGSEGPFAIANLKIADGTKYNSLKDLVNEGMQEKLTAGTGITIENDMISASVQPLYKHELVIPYSFSVTDTASGTATVNGSVIYHYLSNNGTQITSASAIDDNFMLSGGIGKNSANTVLLFDVNVTKAGSSITVEAVNASTMGYITGTVGTITDIVTQLI